MYIKRLIAKRNNEFVVDFEQGKTTFSEASCAYDLPHAEEEKWLEDARRRMENALGANPLKIKERCERQIEDLQKTRGESMLVLRVRKQLQSLLGEDEMRETSTQRVKKDVLALSIPEQYQWLGIPAGTNSKLCGIPGA